MMITTEELQKLLDAATPAMGGLKRISADEWSLDGPGDFSFAYVGREHDVPRLIVIDRGWSSKCSDAIEALCIAAPDLAAELLASRAKLDAAEKLAEALRHEVNRSRRHLAASTLDALAAWEAAQ